MFDKLKAKVSRKWENKEQKAALAAMGLFDQMDMNDASEAAADPFCMDTRAQGAMGGAGRATNLVVGLVVAGLMAAFLLPIAIDEISNVTTTGWSDGAASLWSVLPIMIVLAIFLFFVGLALNNRYYN